MVAPRLWMCVCVCMCACLVCVCVCVFVVDTRFRTRACVNVFELALCKCTPMNTQDGCMSEIACWCLCVCVRVRAYLCVCMCIRIGVLMYLRVFILMHLCVCESYDCIWVLVFALCMSVVISFFLNANLCIGLCLFYTEKRRLTNLRKLCYSRFLDIIFYIRFSNFLL